MDITTKIDMLLTEGDVGKWWYDSASNLYYQVDNDVQMEILLNGVVGKSTDRTLKNGMVRLQFRDFDGGGFLKSIDFKAPSKKFKEIVKYVDKNLKKLKAKAKIEESIVEGYPRGKHKYDDRALEFMANSLDDREWFVLSIIIGFKPNARAEEMAYKSRSHGIPMTMEDYQAIVKSLEGKKVIGKGGRMMPHTRDVWNVKFPNTIASQTHQVVPQLRIR